MDSNFNQTNSEIVSAGYPQAQTAAPAAGAKRFCSYCGQPVDPSAAFCPSCGGQLAQLPARSMPQQPVYQAPAQPVYQTPVQPVYQAPTQPVYRAPNQPAMQQQAAPIQQPYQPYYQPIIINNTNTNVNTNQVSNNAYYRGGTPKNKWVAFLLCFFLGGFGAHKFYEGKIGMGILYLFTGGLFFIGWLIDLIILLCKPNPYYV